MGAVPTAEAGDLETSRIERVKAMEALLVYRAVLIATLLATAMDTSDLLSTEE
jgi:hypothetical protein